MLVYESIDNATHLTMPDLSLSFYFSFKKIYLHIFELSLNIEAWINFIHNTKVTP